MLRTLFKSDIPQALMIEKSVHVTPWTETTFKACFDAGYVGWVIESEKKVIAFIIVSLSPEECHVLNLCVDRAYQHQGFGHHLMETALAHAKYKGIGIAYLEVRKTNTRAISLYKKMNFSQIGERKNYYPTEGGNEDAYVFALSLKS